MNRRQAASAAAAAQRCKHLLHLHSDLLATGDRHNEAEIGTKCVENRIDWRPRRRRNLKAKRDEFGPKKLAEERRRCVDDADENARDDRAKLDRLFHRLQLYQSCREENLQIFKIKNDFEKHFLHLALARAAIWLHG